eukprot:s1874_g3.t1
MAEQISLGCESSQKKLILLTYAMLTSVLSSDSVLDPSKAFECAGLKYERLSFNIVFLSTVPFIGMLLDDFCLF